MPILTSIQLKKLKKKIFNLIMDQRIHFLIIYDIAKILIGFNDHDQFILY